MSKIRGKVRFVYLFWGLILALSLSFLWSALAGQHGFFSYLELKKNLAGLEQRNLELVEENHALQKDVHRLRNDTSFMKKVLREEYGYISNGERVYVVSDPEPADEGREP